VNQHPWIWGDILQFSANVVVKGKNGPTGQGSGHAQNNDESAVLEEFPSEVEEDTVSDVGATMQGVISVWHLTTMMTRQRFENIYSTLKGNLGRS
jgi:hypothetical protein